MLLELEAGLRCSASLVFYHITLSRALCIPPSHFWLFINWFTWPLPKNWCGHYNKLPPPHRRSRDSKWQSSESMEGSSDPWAKCCKHFPWVSLSLCGTSLFGPQVRANADAAGCLALYHLPVLLGMGYCLWTFLPGVPTSPLHFAMSPDACFFSSAHHLSKWLLLHPVTQVEYLGIILDFSFTLISHSQPVIKSGPFYSFMSGSCFFLPNPSFTTVYVNFWLVSCGISPSDSSSTFHDMAFLNYTYNHVGCWSETLLLPAALTLPEQLHPVPWFQLIFPLLIDDLPHLSLQL